MSEDFTQTVSFSEVPVFGVMIGPGDGVDAGKTILEGIKRVLSRNYRIDICFKGINYCKIFDLLLML